MLHSVCSSIRSSFLTMLINSSLSNDIEDFLSNNSYEKKAKGDKALNHIEMKTCRHL